MKKGISDSA